MDINIASVLRKEGLSINVDFSGNVDGLGCTLDSYVLGKPIIFKGTLQDNRGKLNLKGLINLEYDSPCYRCLKNIHGSMEIPVREDILDAAKVADKDDVFTYEGDYLNIDRILLAYIVLNMPMKQLCKDDCKGLCPKCGINLNEAKCRCKVDEDSNPKMDILKNYFK